MCFCLTSVPNKLRLSRLIHCCVPLLSLYAFSFHRGQSIDTSMKQNINETEGECEIPKMIKLRSLCSISLIHPSFLPNCSLWRLRMNDLRDHSLFLFFFFTFSLLCLALHLWSHQPRISSVSTAILGQPGQSEVICGIWLLYCQTPKRT